MFPGGTGGDDGGYNHDRYKAQRSEQVMHRPSGQANASLGIDLEQVLILE